MHPILLRVQDFLSKAQSEGRTVDQALITELGEAAVKAVARSFSPEPREFTLRGSNIGRPICQLLLEQAGAKAEQEPYNHKMRFLIGDLTEQYAILIMRAAGVNIQSVQGTVEWRGKSGTYDVEIDGKIWDVKSASDWSFKNKFTDFEAIYKDDPFGYVGQGVFYQEGANKPFGGWIVVNKSTGEWNVIEFPADGALRLDIISKLDRTIAAVEAREDYRHYIIDDQEEFFRKKPTGNRVLSHICSMCGRRQHCWPTVTYRRELASEAKNPKWKYYSYVDPIFDKIDENKQRKAKGQEVAAVDVPDDTGSLPVSDQP